VNVEAVLTRSGHQASTPRRARVLFFRSVFVGSQSHAVGLKNTHDLLPLVGFGNFAMFGIIDAIVTIRLPVFGAVVFYMEMPALPISTKSGTSPEVAQ
jgi:hypothetical protein